MLNSLMHPRKRPAPKSHPAQRPVEPKTLELPWDSAPGMLDRESLSVLNTARRLEGESRRHANLHFRQSGGFQRDLDSHPDRIVRYNDDNTTAVTVHRDSETREPTYYATMAVDQPYSHIVTWEGGKLDEFRIEDGIGGSICEGHRNENGTLTVTFEQTPPARS